MAPTQTVNTEAAAASLKAALAVAEGLPQAGAVDDPAAARRKQVASIIAITLVVVFCLLLFLLSGLKTFAHHDSKSGARIRRVCGWMPWIPREIPPWETPPLGHFYDPQDDDEVEKGRVTPPVSAKLSARSPKSPKERKGLSAARQRLVDIKAARERYQLDLNAPFFVDGRRRLRGAAGRSVAFASHEDRQSTYSQASAGPSPEHSTPKPNPSPAYLPRSRRAPTTATRPDEATMDGRERALQMLLGKASA
jgi:hypothetical protein